MSRQSRIPRPGLDSRLNPDHAGRCPSGPVAGEGRFVFSFSRGAPALKIPQQGPARAFSIKSVSDRLDGLRRIRALNRRDRRRRKEARDLWAYFDAEGLFEPLNREERHLWEKLSHRGKLNQWYARRLHQVNRGWMIPYLAELLAEGR